ncbi:DUF4817 domain-containing protein [Trichonephila clavipes]|nr:DUF4817 domain-containing protein [Trichonephila clavipes]
MSRFGGLSEERPLVFKTPSKLGTHLSTQCSGDEGRVDLVQPVIEPQTYGVEARYTTARPYWELWFQQNGATCHTARATIDLLKDTFGDRRISRFGPVNWPPRSCDLTPLDYFLWGHVKSLVYADKPQTLDHLEDNIRRVIADIRPQMLEKSSKIGRPDWTTSEPAVAVIC